MLRGTATIMLGREANLCELAHSWSMIAAPIGGPGGSNMAANLAAGISCIPANVDLGGHMALDGSILGNCASEQMEALERDFGDDDDVQVGAVITIVEVQKVQGTDEPGNVRVSSNIRMRHNIGDPFRAVGLMEQAVHNILSNG